MKGTSPQRDGLGSASTSISVDTLAIGECSASATDSVSVARLFEGFPPLTPDYNHYDTQSSLDKSEWILSIPMVMASTKINKSSGMSNVKSIILYLHVICACAEVFPRGECWSSTNKWHCTKSRVEACSKTSVYSNVHSPMDVASVIYSVSSGQLRHGKLHFNPDTR